ncbi:hypothetical protein [Brucella anthropi]|nr:hypothetical protein [Brucella anthropi]
MTSFIYLVSIVVFVRTTIRILDVCFAAFFERIAIAAAIILV